jgi:hypothetical protein
MSIDVNKKLEELMQAGLEAYEILVEEIKRPLDEELQDDKRRNAMKAKKECFLDAKEILSSIKKIENQINGEDESDEVEEEKSFTAGFVEKYAKK